MGSMLKEDFQKLLLQTPEQLAAQLGNGEPGSPTMVAVQSVLDFKLQQALVVEARKMTWITIVVACIPASLNLISAFVR